MDYQVSNEVINKMEWSAVRAKRDGLISSTDWTQMTDTPLTAEKVEAFKVYRQQLRDLPQTVKNPDDVIWPEKPVI